MRTISLKEFHEEINKQGVSREHFAFICPMCGKVQSANDLIKAGAGENFDAVEKYLGFSCVGRFTGQGSPSKNSSNGCNWTLGGLFQTHKLEVEVEGSFYPRFEPASPEQAVQNMQEGGAA